MSSTKTEIHGRFFSITIPQGTDIDQAYLINRDSEFRSDVREILELMWKEYSVYCPDSDFLLDAVKQFQSCAWQMEISLFMQSRFKLIPTGSEGPDLRFLIGGEEVILEAVSAKPGAGPDAVSSPPFGSVYHPDDNGIIIRLRNAIDSKIKQHQRWLRSGVVKGSQPLILAVTAGEISTAIDFFGMSHMEQALFPLDNGAWHVPIKFDGTHAEEPIEFKYGFRESISKKNGSPVSTNVFVTKDAEYISAVIYNPHHFVNSQRTNGRCFRIIHNPNALNPLPQGFMECGVEAWVEKEHLHFKDWRK